MPWPVGNSWFLPHACSAVMATVGWPDAMRRITVHFADDEESLYQSFMGTSESSHYYQGESSSATGTEAPSRTSDDQITADFEYARQLQEMEDLAIDTPPNDDEQDDISCVASPSDTEDDDGGNEEESTREEDNDDDHDDDDEDPDMTYEQGQALVESVGNEGRGLSDELISYLVPSKYKSGFLARKTNHEVCPICLSVFRNRESLITLPCKHNYHAGCITKWLKVNKTCPVCKYEVFGPS